VSRVRRWGTHYLRDCKITYKNLHILDDGRLIMWNINGRVHMTIIAYVEKGIPVRLSA